MAEVVGDLPIQDEFVILDADSNFREVSSALLRPSVKIVFVRDPSIDRIIGVMNENMFLRVIASGINPNRTKLATHMLPNRTSKRGLLRLTKDAPVVDAINLAKSTNPFAIIVEEPLQNKSRKGSSIKSQVLGYISPNDLKSTSISSENSGKEITKKSNLAMEIESSFKPILETAPALYRSLESDKTQLSSDSTIGLSAAEQILSIANQLLSVPSKVNKNNESLSGDDHIYCLVTESPQITSVWPISISEIPTFASDHTVYKVSWADNMLNFSGKNWINDGEKTTSKGVFSITAIISSKLGRMYHIHDIVEFNVNAKSNTDFIQDIASHINPLDNSNNRIIICVKSEIQR